MRRAGASLLLLLVLGVGAVLGGRALLARPGPLPAALAIVVPRGTTASVGEALARADVVESAALFRLAAVLTRADGPIHAAELAFPAHASLARVLVVLRTAAPVEHALTVPEGLTAAAIATLLAAAPALAGPVPVPAEGAVLPQTYDYRWGETRAALVSRMEAAMRATLRRAWAGRDPGLPLRSPRDMLVLASIVERETAIARERPMVARVFLNRLVAGMRLQSDPTVAYAANGGLGPLDRPLTRADLAFANPYNTYVAPGLPPAPICSPGVASLTAVAHPASGDLLFFVADGTGGHAFASTLAAHNLNVMRYRAEGLPSP